MLNCWYENMIHEHCKISHLWTDVTRYFRRFLTTKNIAKSRGKEAKNGGPLKITKQTHFLVTQSQPNKYKEFFIFGCG